MIIKLAIHIPKVIANIAHPEAKQVALDIFQKRQNIGLALGMARKVGPITQTKEVAKQVAKTTERDIQKAVHPSLF